MSTRAEVVICGAGIGGGAAAYFLAVEHGITDIILVDERPPLSLTSDKSTECYRNWWPGPGDAMVQMMNRSIDLLEELADTHNNSFHLNRRGYLYSTTDPNRLADLQGFAEEASRLGAGEIRHHTPGSKTTYQPSHAEGFKDSPEGADLISDPALIQQHFPYLAQEITAALHVRRAGWLSAQQYGMLLLSQARQHGAKLIEATVTAVELAAGKVQAVRLSNGETIQTDTFINAAGPFVGQVAEEMLGVSLPIYNELHLKASINDTHKVVGREAPLLIDTDPQHLVWTAEERAWLEEDEATRWLLEELPSGAHVRPEGGGQAESIIMLWDTHEEAVEPVVPAPQDPMYPEIALRGLCKMLPELGTYLTRFPQPYIDSGYYTKTHENRPLACPLPVEGAYLIGAMSGYGIMASAALGELVAAHVCGTNLPAYASAFDLTRYQDPAYQQLLESWGQTWQL